MTPKMLTALANDLFSKRGRLMSLWQEQAENFYPERADFTAHRTIGMDFAANLTSSFPILCRRDLGDQLSVMLRPTNKPWMHIVPKDTRIKDNQSHRWLEQTEQIQRRAMYDPMAQFTRACKQGDHDFATFGQCVLSAQLNKKRSALIYQDWHLRDVAWRENESGEIDFVARKAKVQLVDMQPTFPTATLDPKILQALTKEPFSEVNVMHVVCLPEMWDGNAMGKKRVSIFYDMDHNRVLEELPIWGRIYLVPRWQTVSGSQYAFSPATIAALPEGRLLQAMTLTILEAGEKAVNPPLIATKDAVKSDMQQYPGGVTWVDMEYDERLGEALRAMNIDVKGLPISLEMIKDSRDVLQQCFFLNKLKAFNPNTDPNMTAFQAGQIVQEYIRGALPLFEPMEMDYNGAICEETFDILYRNGAFGPRDTIPLPLRNQDVDFKFESPLHDAIEQQKGTKFLEFAQIVAQAIQLDPSVAHLPDATEILRDVANGIRVPATWIHTEMEVEQAQANAAQAGAQQATLDTMQKGATVAKTLGDARQANAAAAATAA